MKPCRNFSETIVGSKPKPPKPCVYRHGSRFQAVEMKRSSEKVRKYRTKADVQNKGYGNVVFETRRGCRNFSNGKEL